MRTRIIYRDLEVLLARCGMQKFPTYKLLARRARVSTSQAHGSIKFLKRVKLLHVDGSPNYANIFEFVEHGAKYLFNERGR